jgi:hypothetical protein
MLSIRIPFHRRKFPDGFLRKAVKAFHAGMRQPGWKKAAVSGSRIHAADWG